MTQFLTFSLSKDDIFGQIRLFTSYLAGKRSDTAIAYDRIAAIDLDRPLFDILIEESAGELALRLGSRAQSIEIDGDIIRLTIANPLWLIDLTLFDNPPLPLDNAAILRIIRSYVTSASIHRWLEIIGSDIKDGSSTVSNNTTTLLSDKFQLLDSLLTPPAIPIRSHIPKANPRRIPPLP